MSVGLWLELMLSFFAKMQNPVSTRTYYKHRKDIKRLFDTAKEQDNEALELELHSDFPRPEKYALPLDLYTPVSHVPCT